LRCAWLCGVVLLGACGEPEQAAPAPAAPAAETRFQWRMVTTWPPAFPVFQEGAQRFADDVRAMSAGRLDVEVYAGGELVPPLEVFDAVSQGIVELGHGSAYYWAGKVPAAQFFSSVPFGMDTDGMRAWLYGGGGLELWREVYAPFGVIPMPMGNTGMQMGGWFKRRIDSVEDLQGLRMRIPGLGGKVLASAGGNPVLMAGGEIYTALERGTIDATEWVAPFHDVRLGLQRAAEYYYYPGWHEPGTEFELIISEPAWRQLPADLQRIVEVAAMAAGLWIHAQMEEHNRRALLELRRSTRVQILEFPTEVTDRLREMTAATLRQEAADDAEFDRVYRAYRTFQQQLRGWRDIGSNAYHRHLAPAATAPPSPPP